MPADDRRGRIGGVGRAASKAPDPDPDPRVAKVTGAAEEATISLNKAVDVPLLFRG